MKKPDKNDPKYRKPGNVKSINYERYAFDLDEYISRSIPKDIEICYAIINDSDGSIVSLYRYEDEATERFYDLQSSLSIVTLSLDTIPIF